MAKTSSPKNSAAGDPSSTVLVSSNNNNNNNDNVVKGKRQRRKSVSKETSSRRRSSIYRGVTRHRWTGRYEAHLWDKNCWNESQKKKGRQVYLGAYDEEEAAAHAYDLAALKYWGQHTLLNFHLSTYQKALTEMEGQSREEYIGSLRRKSSGFSRGVSKYRGVARHHHNGRWEARIGRVFGNKYLYLGTYATQEEAAMAYDVASIKYRGFNAVTNFDLSRYIKLLQPLRDNLKSPQPNPNDNVEFIRTMQKPSQELGLHFLNHHQESSSPIIETTTCNGGTTMSALELLLDSSKFKEMLKEIVACNSPSTQEKQTEAEPTKSCFPDDIQTSFDILDSNSLVEEHGIVFGEYDSFGSMMFQCDDLDT